MKLNFANMEEVGMEHFRGGDGTVYAKMFNDGANRIMWCRFPKGASIGEHCHETSSETFYVLSGECRVVMTEGEEILRAGDAHHCPKGATHTVINNGDDELILFAVVPEQ